MTHHELCLLAAEWLRMPYNKKIAKCKILDDRKLQYKIPACKWVAVELVCNGSPCHPDVFGWGDGIGAGNFGVNIEVKMSHADFLADFKKSYRENIYYDLGHIKYFCCPKGVIKPEELPENIGLLYENEGAIEIIRIATERGDKMPSYEVPFIASIMRRLGIKAQTFDYSNRK